MFATTTMKKINTIFTSFKRLKSTVGSCDGALSNIRVLDLTRIVAGPYCTMVLGDMGAEILKIENPDGGDETRNWGPPYVNDSMETCYFTCLNRNKKSVCVNLKTIEGKTIVTNLTKTCDVLVENYVPGVLSKFGLDYEALSDVAPQLIYCSITGYGSKGPYSLRPGYDVIASSIGGLMHITGPRNGEPCKPGVALIDVATGLYAHGAIIAALYQRNITGKGQKIDCNLLSTQLASLINIGSNYLNSGEEATRWGTAHPSIVPYRAYKTSDNKYITVGGGSDKLFADLCLLLELKTLIEDERYQTNADRVKNRESLDRVIEERFRQKTSKRWLEILSKATFPYGPVNTMEEAFNDEHVKSIGLVKRIEHPLAGHVTVVGPAVEFSEASNMVRLPPPTLGQHTEQILSEYLGYSQSEIQTLKSKKIDVTAVRLKLAKPKKDKKVNWAQDTVDNEHMNKKKSKCCCIYTKPRTAFDSSSSENESDLDCDNCRGHVEKKLKRDPENKNEDLTTATNFSSISA